MSTAVGRPDTPTPEPAGSEPGGRRPLRTRGDLITVAVVAVLVTAVSLLGWALIDRGVPILVPWPPLLAEWLPHVGPGTVPAIVLALVVALRGPALAQRLGWRTLLLLSYVVAAGWTLTLALVDGWTRGVGERLATDTEYLKEVPRATVSVPDFLETFTSRIVGMTPGTLVTHASGHPPLATLFYVYLDRIGLTGGYAAGVVTLLVGASAAVAVALVLAALAGQDVARRYLPFGVLFPGAVWVGVSADGMFAAVFAWGVAFLALGAVRRGLGGALLSLLGGVVLGASLYLSYGLVLGGLVPIAVAVLTRRVTPLLWGAVGAAAVVVVFELSGFSWIEGYEMVKLRYYQPGEYGLLRPYEYWVWANFAALALSIGPAVVAGMRRLVWRPRAAPTAVALLVGAVVVAVVVADVSGLSKSEVERIWLPFAAFMTTATVLLPRVSHRWWLLGQAVLALAVNHFLLTTW